MDCRVKVSRGLQVMPAGMTWRQGRGLCAWPLAIGLEPMAPFNGSLIDVFARRIVGWRVSRTATAGFVFDDLEQDIHQRRPARDQLVHHSVRESQYLSIKCTERLAEAKIARPIRSVGDSYDNAWAETINGLFKAEIIHRRGPWRSFEAVEYATLAWVEWFNNCRLLEPIGNILPAKALKSELRPEFRTLT